MPNTPRSQSEDAMTPAQPIKIIGAGIAGLTLARCLRQKGVHSIIFEKGSTAPRHSYGITLLPWAYRPLTRALSMEEQTFLSRVAVGNGRVFQRSDDEKPETSPPVRVHRAKLESLLRQDLDIRWDHAVVDVAEAPNGNTLSWENGESTEAPLVIGAEGVHSRLRDLLDPGSRLKILPFVVFYGRRCIEKDQFQAIYAPSLKGGNVIDARHGDIVLRITIDDYIGNMVDISYTFSRPARQDDPLHKPDRPKSGASLIPQDFFRELAELGNMAQPFSEVFDPAKVSQDRVLHWLMRSLIVSSDELQNMAKRKVVLLGDSAHPTPILGGQGASMAIRDAVELASHVATHGDSGLSQFQASRLEEWRTGVEDSETTLRNLHSGQSSLL